MQELTYRTKFRLHIITGVIAAFCGILFIRLFYIQLIRGSVYYRQAMANRTQIIKVQANRSIIYDRTLENRIAYNRKSMSIIAIPANMPADPDEHARVLSNISLLLEMSIEEITNIIREQALDKYTPVVLKYDIDSRTLVRFTEQLNRYPGLYWENRPRRIYPLREKAAQLIGYTGVINKDELRRLRKNPEYHSGTILGKIGIERFFDEEVRGREGILERVVDAKGNVLEQDMEREPVPGHILVLSIDRDLQEMAYDQMGDKIGAVVVSRPSTGEILALVSKPSFDPNIFTDRFTMEEFFVLKQNVDKPFLNRAIQGTYPPSSIFKMVSASAFLQAGLPTDRIVHCPGWLRIGNRIFKCWDVHHNQSLVGGIAHSCDVYFYTMGLQATREPIIAMAESYGIHKRTGIDLPGETVGLIPDMDWFRKKYNRPWQNGDTANISIGQGDLLATPLAINLLTCAIVNDGLVYKPFLLKQKLSLNNKSVLWTKIPEVLRKVNLSDKQFELLRKSMYGVTRYGTARWIQYATDIPIAGKTGTGEAGKDKENHALFTAYAPYGETNRDNIIAVTVVAEHGGGGSGIAAPIAVRLIDYYIRKKAKIPYQKIRPGPAE